MEEEKVVLVNELDEELGTMGKLEAHEKGCLHRAFSIFIFNKEDDLLIQRRAVTKYHSGGLWTNTCCSHPRWGEPVKAAAERRLKEEMGIVASIERRFSFLYKAEFDNGLIEHELDHVFFGRYDGIFQPDPEEVAEWKAIAVDDLDADLSLHPQAYTAWLHDCWSQIKIEIGKGI